MGFMALTVFFFAKQARDKTVLTSLNLLTTSASCNVRNPKSPCATLYVCRGQVLYGFFVHNEVDKLLTNLNCPFNDYTYISVWWIMSSIKELIHLSVKGSVIQCHPCHSLMFNTSHNRQGCACPCHNLIHLSCHYFFWRWFSGYSPFLCLEKI